MLPEGGAIGRTAGSRASGDVVGGADPRAADVVRGEPLPEVAQALALGRPGAEIARHAGRAAAAAEHRSTVAVERRAAARARGRGSRAGGPGRKAGGVVSLALVSVAAGVGAG